MKKFIEQRDIRSVVHFTRLENLPSILEHGIVPRSLLDDDGRDFLFNDTIRKDGYTHASSFSLSWPNYKMFYQLRIRPENAGAKWAVIDCSTAVLLEKECIFSAYNAATVEARAVDEEARRGLPGLAAMFEEREGKPSREEMRLDPSEPTDPQAEVLVLDIVEPKYFDRICIYDMTSKLDFAKRYPKFTFVDGWEHPRSDHKHWKERIRG
ncbi:DarT ssDNA thymidine ADP-ribosyltransferase family protein [Burkholderia gladioli]|uniref:DarT ssDNA thymidine ADP-ribosyltransferase family protein n=1 Tax=Burkholderia gladioli TaxID=28095 RepID=UPI001641075C|nr:DarT ssDNA thymidine ADP-ribosyltransferase family protein [Burkholderia gladioli]